MRREAGTLRLKSCVRSLGLLMIAAAAIDCGDDAPPAATGSQLTCGEGTMLQGTTCVLVDAGGGGTGDGGAVTCGAGTVQVGDQCVMAEAAVEAGAGRIESFTADRLWGDAPLSTTFSWTIVDAPPDAVCELDSDGDGTFETPVPACAGQGSAPGLITAVGPATAVLRMKSAAGQVEAAETLFSNRVDWVPNLVRVRELTGLVSSTADGDVVTLEFQQAAQVPTVESGAILFDRSHDGYVRKVVTVTTSSNKLQAQTTEGSLEDLATGGFYGIRTPPLGGGNRKVTDCDPSSWPASWNGVEVPIADQTFVAAGLGSPVSGALELTSNTLGLGYRFVDPNISWAPLKVNFELQTKAALCTRASAKIGAKFREAWPLPIPHASYVFKFGPIIDIVVGFIVEVGVDVNSLTKASADYVLAAETSSGIEWSNQKIELWNRQTPSADAKNFDVSTEAVAALFINPAVVASYGKVPKGCTEQKPKFSFRAALDNEIGVKIRASLNVEKLCLDAILYESSVLRFAPPGNLLKCYEVPLPWAPEIPLIDHPYCIPFEPAGAGGSGGGGPDDSGLGGQAGSAGSDASTSQGGSAGTSTGGAAGEGGSGGTGGTSGADAGTDASLDASEDAPAEAEAGPGCTSGLPCSPSTPCHVGETACPDGGSVCVDTGVIAPDGADCATDGICTAGVCGPAPALLSILQGQGGVAYENQKIAPIVLSLRRKSDNAPLAGVAVNVAGPEGAVIESGSGSTDLNGKITLVLRLPPRAGSHVFNAQAAEAHSVDILATAQVPPAGMITPLINASYACAYVLPFVPSAAAVARPWRAGSVAWGADGSAFFSEALETCRIFKMSNAGVVQVIGGEGSSICGSDGDLGPALTAGISNPSMLVLDEARQRLLFRDDYPGYAGYPELMHAIRAIDLKTGLIETIAGRGTSTAPEFGDNGPATGANLYVNGTVLGPDQALYLIDVLKDAIRRIDLDTGIITSWYKPNIVDCTLVPLRTTALRYGPWFDQSGNAYFAASVCGTSLGLDGSELPLAIVRRTPGGILQHVAGTLGSDPAANEDGKPASGMNGLGWLSGGFFVARNGDLYFFDDYPQPRVLRRVDATTGLLSTIAGVASNSTAPSGDFGPASSATGMFFPITEPPFARLALGQGCAVRLLW